MVVVSAFLSYRVDAVEATAPQTLESGPPQALLGIVEEPPHRGSPCSGRPDAGIPGPFCSVAPQLPRVPPGLCEVFYAAAKITINGERITIHLSWRRWVHQNVNLFNTGLAAIEHRVRRWNRHPPRRHREFMPIVPQVPLLIVFCNTFHSPPPQRKARRGSVHLVVSPLPSHRSIIRLT